MRKTMKPKPRPHKRVEEQPHPIYNPVPHLMNATEEEPNMPEEENTEQLTSTPPTAADILQQLLPLLIQLFGATIAREHPAMAKLQGMHTDTVLATHDAG